MPCLKRIQFEKQPPASIRKSNFFHFVASFFDENEQPLELMEAKFVDFVDCPGIYHGRISGMDSCSGKKLSFEGAALKNENPILNGTEESRKSLETERKMDPKDVVSKVDGACGQIKTEGGGFVNVSNTNTGDQEESEIGSPMDAVTDESVNEVVLEEKEGKAVIFKNGICYELAFKSGDSILRTKIYLFVVNDHSQELVMYEGNEKNPKSARVLITHSAHCSRCSSGRSCGNKNETPSDPIIKDRFFADFAVKCNQNCLKYAGRICNPDVVRKFQFAIVDTPVYDPAGVKLGLSESIFVHNNSKYGRKHDIKVDKNTINFAPEILHVNPNQGWTSGGQEITIIGKNFTNRMQIVFGKTICTEMKFLTPNALSVKLPETSHSHICEVNVAVKGRIVRENSDAKKFIYLAAHESGVEAGIDRLASLLPSERRGANAEYILNESARLMKELLLYREETLRYKSLNYTPHSPRKDIDTHDIVQYAHVPRRGQTNTRTYSGCSTPTSDIRERREVGEEHQGAFDRVREFDERRSELRESVVYERQHGQFYEQGEYIVNSRLPQFREIPVQHSLPVKRPRLSGPNGREEVPPEYAHSSEGYRHPLDFNGRNLQEIPRDFPRKSPRGPIPIENVRSFQRPHTQYMHEYPGAPSREALYTRRMYNGAPLMQPHSATPRRQISQDPIEVRTS
eukprot:Nk52_evm6s287 gene=Nk52_evmTU6s287